MNTVYWILAFVLSFAIGYWVYLADKKRNIAYPLLTAGLRFVVVLLTFLLLLAPLFSIKETITKKPIVLFLQDNSTSIAQALQKDSTTYQQNSLSLLDKLSNKYQVVKWGFGADIQKDTLFQYTQPSTNISQALTSAVDFYGQQNLAAIILATDGRFNEGAHPLYLNLPYEGSLYTIALGDTAVQKDIRISAVYANKSVMLNSQFEIRFDVLATQCKGYNGEILLKNATNNQVIKTTSLSIASDNFDKTLSFQVQAEKSGLHHYIIELPKAEDEKNSMNNKKDVFVEVVQEKKNILLIAAAPHPDVNAIREALKGQENYNLTIITFDKIPKDLSTYQLFILQGLPSTSVAIPNEILKKPTWFLLSKGSNGAAIQATQVAALSVNTLNFQNQFAQFTSGFSSFLLPPNYQAVMDKMPPLSCPIGKVDPGINTNVLLTSKTNGQPLWLLQQGSVPRALLAGEGLWRWRMYEYRFFSKQDVIDEMIRQTVTFLTTLSQEKPFKVQLPKAIWKDKETINFDAYLLNENKEQINSEEVKMVISDSSGEKQSYQFAKSGSAYQLNIGSRAEGNFHYIATVNYQGKTYTEQGDFTVQDIPIESLETGADYSLLYALSSQYNGHVVTPAQEVSLFDSLQNNNHIKPILQEYDKTIPMIDWKWYFILILTLATVEWLLRKYWMAQ